MRVLNVGGGASRVLPEHYKAWEQDILDIDPDVKPDICCDALLMKTLPAAQYDAVYCSHNLEHFYQHDVPVVLAGFLHVLKRNGRAEIHVPNLRELVEELQTKDIEDVWYQSSGGPITFHDVLYGWGRAMGSGNLYYAHKCGFTAKSLHRALATAGFSRIHVEEQGPNLQAKAVKC